MEYRGSKQPPSRTAPDSLPHHEAGTSRRQHPAGEVKHGGSVQLLRMLLFAIWSAGSAVCIHLTQILGSPLYFFNKDYYYAYMALTKQSFGLLMTTMCQWFSPTLIRVSGDASIRGQLKQTNDRRLETTFPERLIWWQTTNSILIGYIYGG